MNHFITKVQGSALLLLLFVMTMMGIVVANFWRSTSYALVLALERVRYEQQFRAAQGLLTYGIAFARLNFELLALRAKQGAVTIPFATWPGGGQDNFQGALSYELNNVALAIKAQVTGKQGNVTALSCALEQSRTEGPSTHVAANSRYNIVNWKINAS